jgi:Tol biopolymer transport system component
MTIQAGTRLGPYEVIESIGAGGMGEVYRARDTRLDRTVAIKILPDSLSGDPQFRERFAREARVISQLDHPNICPLYDVGQEDGTAYLVMQYLQGETLAETLARGPMRLDDVSTYAIQIADALARAHGSGIVHRDLKPGNVILTKFGARLLDFGLAKTSGVTLPSGASLLTTTTAGLTMQGSILGTFQYMAPEQIEGGDADTRSDIWAFGCVLYEMITGSRAFVGKSHASLIANILQSQPAPILQAQPLASAALDHIVQGCLEKDPQMRWQSIADVGRELRWASTAADAVSRPTPTARGSRLMLRGLAAALLLAAGAIAATLLQRAAAIPAPPHTKLTLLPPADLTLTPFASQGTPSFALSPDGKHIVFVASAVGRAPSLWVRALASRVALELPDSEDAVSPFWSSNGQSIAFFAQGYLKTIALNGERPTRLRRVTDHAGGAWSGDVILIGHQSGPLERIAASGGSATAATDQGSGAVGGHRWPQFLPDGRHFMFTERGGAVRIGQVGSTWTTPVLNSDRTAVYADTGHLLFVQDRRLMAQAVDRSWKPVGPARQIMDDVWYAAGFGMPPVSISADGLLAYWDGTTVMVGWGWFDGQGNPLPATPPPTDARGVRISRADGRVGYEFSMEGSRQQVWLMDSTGRTSRLTFADRGAGAPVWSPDGREILFTSIVDGVTEVFRQATSGLGREQQIARVPPSSRVTPGDRNILDWSRDRQHALVTLSAPATGRDIALLSVDTGQITPLIQTAAAEIQARFSPDGRWIAYASNETGRWEVFVEPFPVTGTRWQVSTDGGSQPIWRENGDELYFLAPDSKLMSVPVRTGTSFSRGTPRPLFQTRMRPTYPPYPVNYDIAADAKHFLINGVRPDTGPVISIVANWRELLKQKP